MVELRVTQPEAKLWNKFRAVCLRNYEFCVVFNNEMCLCHESLQMENKTSSGLEKVFCHRLLLEFFSFRRKYDCLADKRAKEHRSRQQITVKRLWNEYVRVWQTKLSAWLHVASAHSKSCETRELMTTHFSPSLDGCPVAHRITCTGSPANQKPSFSTAPSSQ